MRREWHIYCHLPELVHSEARGCLRGGGAAGARRRMEAVVPYLDVIDEYEPAATMRSWARREPNLDL